MIYLYDEFKGIPPLYEQQNNNDEMIAYLRYYIEGSNWEWLIFEYSPLQKLFYGVVIKDDEVKYQYFTLAEINGIYKQYGVRALRDFRFKPTTLKELQNGKRVA